MFGVHQPARRLRPQCAAGTHAKSEQMHQASYHPMLRGNRLLPLLIVLLRLL